MSSGVVSTSYAGSTTVTTTTKTKSTATTLSGKTIDATREVSCNVIHHPSTNGTSTSTPSKHSSSGASSEKNTTTDNNTSDANSNGNSGNIPATTPSGKTSAFSLVSPIKVTNVPASPAATSNGLKRSDTPSSGSLLSSERLDEDEMGSPSAKRTVTASPSAPTDWSAIEEHLYQKLRESDLSILLNHIKGLERSAIDLYRREDEETAKTAELRILDISESSPVTTPRKTKPSPASTPSSATTTTTKTTNPTSNTTQQHHSINHHTSTPSHPCDSPSTATRTATTTTTTTTTKLGSPIPTPAEATINSSTNSCLTVTPSSVIS